jgi:hypothetical protein
MTLRLRHFTLSQDAGKNTFGFTFSNGPSRIGIATDLGYVDNAVRIEIWRHAN